MTRKQILDYLEDCDFTTRELQEDTREISVINHISSSLSLESYESGATKIVLFPYEENFVIKIPFEGSCYGDNSEDGEFARNEHANKDHKYNWDYCLTEVLLYREAKKEKINKMFCETKLIGFVQDYPIYIQERVKQFEAPKKSVSSISPIVKRASLDNGISVNLGWLDDVLHFYGESKFNRFIKFLWWQDIDDLHNGNLGYREDGSPCIYDYSGWRS